MVEFNGFMRLIQVKAGAVQVLYFYITDVAFQMATSKVVQEASYHRQ